MTSNDELEHAAPSEEEMRKLLKPCCTPDQVIGVLKKSYVGNGEQNVRIVKELESYDDKNYWVDINGTHYLVKVHNGVESNDLKELLKESSHEKSVIHLQNTMMEHLSSAGISTSRPQNTLASEPSTPTPACFYPLPVVSREHSPCEVVVRLLRWVPGRTMASLKMLPLESIADAGCFLGRLRDKLDLLEADKLVAAKRYHQWDGKNTRDLAEFVDCIKDERKRNMVTSILDAFQTELIDSGVADTFPQALIHGDYNDANILMDENSRVSGVIDFGDSVHR
jgi:Ser/Thr protein kinase RdoA (MazF antagonist)